VEAKVDFVVSGDDDLLRIKQFRGITILAPRVFLETKLNRA
jgi:predicted nucleic acid-binding protein